jgi:hypothetical protein
MLCFGLFPQAAAPACENKETVFGGFGRKKKAKKTRIGGSRPPIRVSNVRMFIFLIFTKKARKNGSVSILFCHNKL